MGTVAQIQLNDVEVECTPDKLPKYLTADISKLSAHQRFTIGDLEAAEEISIIGDPNVIIATVANIKEDRTEDKAPDDPLALHTDPPTSTPS